MNINIIVVLIIWVFFGVLGYAVTFAYFQHEWPDSAKTDYREQMGSAAFIGLFGPIGLIIVFFATGFAKHGLKFRQSIHKER